MDVQSNDTKSMAAAAIGYAEQGFAVFPCHTITDGQCSCGKECHSPAKHPRTKNGLTDATKDEKQIRALFARPANVAIATGEASKIVVIDIDPAKGGLESLAAIQAEHDQLPNTVEVETGGNGTHFYFKYPWDAKIGSRNGRWPGIDIKADGGYVIAPPSQHISGGNYLWADGRSPSQHPMAEIPGWMLPLLPQKDDDQNNAPHNPATQSTVTDGRDLLLQRGQQYAAAVSGASEGGRNQAAFNLAGHLASFETDGCRLSEVDILSVLRSWNDRCSPPLEDRELHTCVTSSMANGTPRAPKEVKILPFRKSTKDGDSEGKERKSQATELVELAAECDLFQDPDGEAYARFPVGDGNDLHWEVSPVCTKPFRRWLKRRFYKATDKTPSAQSLQDALGVIEAKAIYDGDRRKVFIRLAEHEDRIYLDLVSDNWQAIEIDRLGWRVVNDPPVMFRRAKAMRPLPVPDSHGDINALRKFVNISDADWPLLLAWLVAAMRPTGPYPVLAVYGEHGSAKSTLCRLIRKIIDPNLSPLRADYREPRDLMICANSGWIVALDNLSVIKDWLSDCFCRLSTGGGFSTRTLYENSEETIFDAKRPLILNCIDEVVTRSDLLDRCVLLNLPRIDRDKRKSEAQLDREFDEAVPAILGGLLTAVSVAIRNQDQVKLPSLPRMADFAIWASAAEPALGLEVGAFMREYIANRESGNETALEASPIGKVLIEFVIGAGQWSGTSTDLLKELDGRVDEKTRKLESWPKAPRTLGSAVKRLAPNLREAGVGVEFGRKGHKGARTITLATQLEHSGNSSSASSALSAVQDSPESGGIRADATADAKPDADATGFRPSSAENRIFTEENGIADATDDADAKNPVRSSEPQWCEV